MRRQPDPGSLIPAVVMALLVALAFLLPMVLYSVRGQSRPLPTHQHRRIFPMKPTEYVTAAQPKI